MHLRNPFAFRPGPVSFWTTVIYIALVIPIIYVHETVPPAPANRSLYTGLNLTEAWQDLQAITRTFHPYNSRENDVVRETIINKSKEILDRNKVQYTVEALENISRRDDIEFEDSDEISIRDPKPAGVTIFDDQISNVTWTYNTERRIGANIGTSKWAGQYFEGNNYYIYIHGKDDPPGDWWLSESRNKKFQGSGGVLVNCHFDSVSTGYGATDDGIGCVSMLQLLSHFTSTGRQPRNGIVLLFNNAEEDGLLGARAFGNSPLLQFCHTFVNLEGAGAGGRALLFRTSDLQSAKAYGKSPHPFGSVLAANAFEMGFIKSGTDFEIWDGVYGQRGLDIAFYEPRSRYHTIEDDARHATVNSIWHMLSAALATTQKLSETTGTHFHGDRSDGDKDKVQNGKQTKGVWFDMFGKAWVAFSLRGLFAWSLVLLVATPLILCAITYVLIRKNKYYFFARNIKTHDDSDNDPVVLGGWRGFFRFPFAVISAGAVTIASAFLLAKFNPFIVYRNGYTVWAMTLSLFYFSLWLIMRGASFVRPSALHRGFVLIWMFAFGWVIQVGAAVAEDRYHYAFLYSAVFLQSGAFAALLISLMEQFALLKKRDFAMQLHDAHHARDRLGRTATHPHGGDGEQDEPEEGDAENPPDSPTETTPLRAGEQGYGSNTQTFANTYRRSVSENVDGPSSPVLKSYQPFEFEQTWSGRLPSWTWFLQFLLLAPVPVFLFGNIGLTAMTALRMTGTDGSIVKTPLLAISVLSIFLLLPLAPFIHRVTHHVPMFLLCISAGTLIYNLVAFPFDTDHRFKFFFQQKIDLDHGTNEVILSGIEDFTHQIIKDLPMAAGKHVNCSEPTFGRDSLRDCRFATEEYPPDLVPGKKFDELFTFKTLPSDDRAIGKFQLQALETRVCFVFSSRPVFHFEIEGGGQRDKRFGSFPSDGLENMILWRRDWDKAWNVTLHLTDDDHRLEDATASADPWDITVVCLWSDANNASTIPAFSEVLQYMPSWSIVTKRNVGLVEVKKTFKLQD